MKKLIIFMLLLAVGVGEMKATEYTIFFRPYTGSLSEGNNWMSSDAVFGLGKTNDTSVNGKTATVVAYFENAGNGLYKASINTDGTISHINLLRLNSAHNETWNYSNWISVPQSDIYYEQGYGDWDSWNPSVANYYVIAGDAAIVNNGESWSGNSTNNRLRFASDFATSNIMNLTVNKLLIAGRTYEYQGVINNTNWYPSGSHASFSVGADGYYDITYSYNTSNNNVSASQTLTQAVDMKYYVKQYVNSDYTELGEMALVDGVQTFTFTPLNLTAESNNLQYKIASKAYVGGTYQEGSEDLSYYSSGVDGRFIFTPVLSGNHTVTFFYTPSSNSSEVIANKLATNYYYLGGNGTWPVNQDNVLTETSTGVYSITVSNKPGHTFAIVPEDAFTDASTIPDGNWKYAIHPRIAAGNVNVSFDNQNGFIKVAECSNNWAVPSTFDGKITITFNSTNNKWSVAPYYEKTFGSTGYLTFSNGSKYQVSSGTEVYIVKTTGAGEANMTKLSDNPVLEGGVGRGTGVILKGDNGNTVTITPSTSETVADVSGNLLAGSGDNTYDLSGDFGSGSPQYYKAYILTDKGSGARFYAWSGEDSKKTLSAHKSFLAVEMESNPYTSGAPAFYDFLNFNFGGETTDIKAVNHEPITNNRCFNLNGQRVTNPSKGLYIVNGKKVVLK